VIGFAHRGGRGDAPENTMPAFALALEVGARGLESDVWVTADGVPVLSHDGVVGGVSIPDNQRSALPGAVPGLSDLYRQLGSDFDLSLDLRDNRPGTAAHAIDVARRMGDPSRLYLCGAAERARDWLAVDDRVHPVASVPPRLAGPAFDEHVRRLAGLGVRVANMRWTWWNRGRVDAAHRAGLLAFAWDVQTRRRVRSMRALGCDGVYSDHVARMVAGLQSG
jgi:glycerophosphoryl diester phosphodiesterase